MSYNQTNIIDDKRSIAKKIFARYAKIYQTNAQMLSGFTIAGYLLTQIIVINICNYYLPLLRPDFAHGPVIMSVLSVIFFAYLSRAFYLIQLDNKKNELIEHMLSQAQKKNIITELHRYVLQYKSKNKRDREFANSVLY